MHLDRWQRCTVRGCALPVIQDGGTALAVKVESCKLSLVPGCALVSMLLLFSRLNLEPLGTCMGTWNIYIYVHEALGTRVSVKMASNCRYNLKLLKCAARRLSALDTMHRRMGAWACSFQKAAVCRRGHIATGIQLRACFRAAKLVAHLSTSL